MRPTGLVTRRREIAFGGVFGTPGYLYVVNADGSEPTRLTQWTTNPQDCTHASWSPDGQAIAFWSDLDGNADIHVIAADGSGLRRLTDDPAYDADPAWQPAGAQPWLIVSEDPHMRVSDDPRAGTLLAGYRFEAVLGRGGMGVVYLAEDPRLGRKVAMKLLAELAADQRFRERFLRESELAVSLEHPGIVPVYEAGEAEGRSTSRWATSRAPISRACSRARGGLSPSGRL